MAITSNTTRSTYILELHEPSTDPPLRELPPLSDGEGFGAWDWSPDGNRLAGTILPKDGFGPGVAVFDFPTDSYRRASDKGFYPHWLADGRRLIVGQPSGAFLLDTATGESKGIFSVLPDRLLSEARPAAEDSILAFTRVSDEADIWMITFQEP